MIRKITLLLVMVLSVFCGAVQAKVIYRFNSSLDIQRQYTTQIIRELSESEIEVIVFDSNLQLLSHKIVTGNMPANLCADKILTEDVTRFGHAYKYWFSEQLQYCEIDPKAFPYSYNAVISEQYIEPSIIVLHIPNDIAADLELPEGQLIQYIFQLIPIAEFSSLYPAISTRLTKNGTLVVKEGKYTFQLLLLSKGDMK
ncbi:hypothetical protein K0H59_17985 [Shewanella sp. FJAT-51649]|uniref:hypothetical protein n=1 Tax=Shewanella sp. FJAT-51649 TaxID=2864210 RepID=UPI001C65C00A|nr:hypothetical protein [Shewanella sp. FJAT-51649]QYJ70887.1 hypothetical protein K0H59_17985 [Shewanella sp. FJAT-51649]